MGGSGAALAGSTLYPYVPFIAGSTKRSPTRPARFVHHGGSCAKHRQKPIVGTKSCILSPLIQCDRGSPRNVVILLYISPVNEFLGQDLDSSVASHSAAVIRLRIVSPKRTCSLECKTENDSRRRTSLDPCSTSVLLIFIASAALASASSFCPTTAHCCLYRSGCLLGPFGLEWITDDKALSDLGHVGIIFLLFIVGLDLPPQKIRNVAWRDNRYRSSKHVAVFFLVGLGIGLLFGYFRCWKPSLQESPLFSLAP